MEHPDWPLIYFIRHGQTDWNKESRFQGQKNVPLNDFGRNQAKLSGEILNELLQRDNVDPNSFSWFCSPLDRTKETMELVRAQMDFPALPDVVYDDRLREISFGRLEGHLASEVEKLFPTEHAAREQSKWRHRPEGGESYTELNQRLAGFLREKVFQPTIIVAHGGVARAARHLLTGEPGANIDQWVVPQEAVFRFQNGQFTEYAA